MNGSMGKFATQQVGQKVTWKQGQENMTVKLGLKKQWLVKRNTIT